MKHEISRSDILPMDRYAAERKERYRAISAVKQNRRVEVGPFATLYFENYDTMWFQVHEMLHIERGGEEQIAGELEAYNPLIPQGAELIATFMIEISDPDRRNRVLATLGGIEDTIAIRTGGQTIRAMAETDLERTDETGRTSSVHFLHFAFSPAQIDAFGAPGAEVVISISHPNYRHMAVLPEAVRAALAEDFD
jgi:hypothetical protein